MCTVALILFAVSQNKTTTDMAFIDYYKIMGIPKDAPQAEISKAYKRRARQFHPDLHPDDPKAKAKFQALNEANAVLSDPEKRKKYDKYGEQWEHADAFEKAGGGFGGPGGFSYGSGPDGFDFSGFSGTGGFSSFFEDLFGRGARGASRNGVYGGGTASYDVQSTVSIDLYTAILGGDILLQTQNGKLKLKVKPETQNGTKIRLRGKGLQKPDGTFGNLIITYEVKIPTGLNDHQRELLRQMRDAK